MKGLILKLIFLLECANEIKSIICNSNGSAINAHVKRAS